MKKKTNIKLYMLLILFVCVGVDYLFTVVGRLKAADDSGLTCPYVIQISTGSEDGSEIGIIRIHYTDAQGNKRSQYLMPTDGDLRKSLVKANEIGGENAKITTAKDISGYEIDTWETFDVPGLAANSTDTYLMDFLYGVNSIDEVQIIPAAANGRSVDWQCLGMRFYEVSKTDGKWDIYGVGMKGYLSDNYYIRFAGKLKAAVYNNGQQKLSHLFQANGNTQIFPITKETDKKQAVRLYTSGFSEEDINYSTEEYQLYQFRIDFADVYGAGVESYANSFDKNQMGVQNYQIPESLIATVAYTDRFGVSNVVKIPVFTSFITSLRNDGAFINSKIYNLSYQHLVDIAGQGESVVFPLYLPDCESVDSVQFEYGADRPEKVIGWKAVKDAKVETSKKIKEKMKEDNDNISISAFCIMEAQNVSGNRFVVPGMRLKYDSFLVPEEIFPVRWYYNTNNYEGVEIVANTVSENFKLNPYSDNVNLRPTLTGDYYLFSFETDDTSLAGSDSDITMKVQYRATSGKLVTTDDVHLSTLAKNFYGYWPDSKGEDVSPLIGTQSGRHLCGIMKIDCVDSFENITFKVNNGTDDWQVSNIQIFQVTSISPREGYFLGSDALNAFHSGEWDWIAGPQDDRTVTLGDHKIDRMYTRAVNGVTIYDQVLRPNKKYGTFDLDDYEKNESYDFDKIKGKLDPTDEECVLNIEATVNVSNKKDKTISFDGEVVSDKPFDWLKPYQDSMSYEITRKNLGFARPQITYDVDVYVLSDINDGSNNGDCGSANLFYFQLLFEDGTSAFVEANQQLSGDSFHAGAKETFSITVNKDYGALKAIRVLPDATQENSNIYDKLKVEKIEVSTADDAAIKNKYVFEIKDWIGFDSVKDDEEELKERNIDELSKIFYITSTNKTARCEFEIRMAPEKADKDASIQPFEGAVQATINYKDDDGNSQVCNFDLVKAIYDYRGENPEIAKINGKDRAISNSVNMFRPGKADRFYYDIDNLKTLQSITFTCVDPNAKSTFDIYGINVNRITGDKGVIINANDEYAKVCDSLTTVAYNVGYNVNYEGHESEQIAPLLCPQNESRSTSKIYFVQESENAFKYTAEGDWYYEIKDDNDDRQKGEWLNIYVKAVREPSNGAFKGYTKLNKRPEFKIRYENNAHIGKDETITNYEEVQVNADTFEYTINKYPIEGYLSSIDMISIVGCPTGKAGAATDEPTWKVVDFYIQHVSNGNIRNTYRAEFALMNAYMDASLVPGAMPSKLDSVNDREWPNNRFGKAAVLYASVGDVGDNLKLTHNSKDVAFKVTYRKDAADNTELKSRYIYLSDYIGEENDFILKDRQFIEIPIYDIAPNDIVNLQVEVSGGLSVMFNSLAIGLYEDASYQKLEKWYSFYMPNSVYEITNGSRVLTPISREMTDNTVAVPVEIQFVTADKDKLDYETGTDKPISMIINFVDRYGNRKSKVYENILPYVQEGDFQSGSTAIIKLLEPEMVNIQSVYLKPYDSDEKVNVSWTLESMRIIYGQVAAGGDETVETNYDPVVVGKKITEEEGAIISAYNMNIVFTEATTGDRTIYPETNREITVDSTTRKAEVNYVLELPSRFINTGSLVSVKVYRMDGLTRTDVTNQGVSLYNNGSKISLTFPESVSQDTIYQLEITGNGAFMDYSNTVDFRVPQKIVNPEEN